MTHTPGPWLVDKEGRSFVVNPDLKEPQYIGDEDVRYYGGALIAESIFNPADRALIATAPEVLEACKEAFDALINTHSHPKLLKDMLKSGELERILERMGADTFDPTGRIRSILKLRAAIAKAEGAQ